jgi:hypothetical protein
MSTPPQKNHPPATQQVSFTFQVFWALSSAILLKSFWWIRNMALVIWVLGREAYFRDGVRVLPGKPIRFSTGELAPQLPDMVTGFGYFFIVVFGWTALLSLGRRAYERNRKKRRAS